MDFESSDIKEKGKSQRAKTLWLLFAITQTKPSQQSRRHNSRVLCNIALVEAGGVEPPSENTSSGTSPGADGCFHSRAMTQAVMLHGLVASLVMPGAKLTPVTCTTQVTPKPGSWSFRGGRPLLSSGENFVVVVL